MLPLSNNVIPLMLLSFLMDSAKGYMQHTNQTGYSGKPAWLQTQWGRYPFSPIVLDCFIDISEEQLDLFPDSLPKAYFVEHVHHVRACQDLIVHIYQGDGSQFLMSSFSPFCL